MKIGEFIKTFEIKNIIDSIGYNYTNSVRKIKYATKYMLLLSSRGEERVLEIGKTNLNDSERYMPTFGDNLKFISWNQI